VHWSGLSISVSYVFLTIPSPLRQFPSRMIRSASTDLLVVPPFKLSTIGSRIFNVAAARSWNGLPEDVTSSPTLPAFRKAENAFVSSILS